jgi:hypothetical protein
MTSIPRLSRMLRQLFLSEASELARAHGDFQLCYTLSGYSHLCLLKHFPKEQEINA